MHYQKKGTSAAQAASSSMPPPSVAAVNAQPPVAAGVVPLVQIPKAELAAMQTDQDKKQFLGNYLYQYVLKKIQSNASTLAALGGNAELLAGRVTGMILDGQTIEFILYLCGDQNAFYQIVEEALTMIQKSMAAAPTEEEGAKDAVAAN